MRRQGPIPVEVQVNTLRVIHHRLFGSWPDLYRVHSKEEWQARSDESARSVYGSGWTEQEALIELLYERITGSFGHVYKGEL